MEFSWRKALSMQEGCQVKKTVVILGRSRSGTSMVSGMCAKLGVDMRETDNRSSIHSPRGAFENSHFIAMTTEMSAGRFTETVLNMKKCIELRDSESDLWGWKSALTHNFIDHFVPHLRNPHFIYVFRNPIGIATSEAHIKGFLPGDPGYDDNFLISLKNTARDIAILESCMGRYSKIPSIVFEFEEVRKKPEWSVARLETFLGMLQDIKKVQVATELIDSDYCSAHEYCRELLK